MEEMKVISRVLEPTPWCAGIAAVPKKTGAVRICIDLKALNENAHERPILFPKWTRRWHNSPERQCSASLMPTVGFGRSHLPRPPSC